MLFLNSSILFGHFAIWTLLFAVAIGIFIVVMVRRHGPPVALGRTNVLLGPQLLTLFWLHGIFFSPPRNNGALGGMSFFEFWFDATRGHDVSKHEVLYLALLAGVAAPLYLASVLKRRYLATASGVAVPLSALGVFYLAAFCVRIAIAQTLSIVNHTRFGDETLPTLYAEDLDVRSTVNATFLAFALTYVAYRLTRASASLKATSRLPG
jgi:hypothetical protein